MVNADTNTVVPIAGAATVDVCHDGRRKRKQDGKTDKLHDHEDLGLTKLVGIYLIGLTLLTSLRAVRGKWGDFMLYKYPWKKPCRTQF